VPVRMPKSRREVFHVPVKSFARTHRSSHKVRRSAHKALLLLTQ
jgi:hypothetical protein